MKKGIIILGSSNSNGTTMKIASFIGARTDFPIIDLNTKIIGKFDYEFNNRDDDFLPLIRHIVESYQIIVFATPVYWYSMSGTMKIFFDRLSDCLKTEKATGRKLRGMEMAVVCCGCDQELKKRVLYALYRNSKVFRHDLSGRYVLCGGEWPSYNQ